MNVIKKVGGETIVLGFGTTLLSVIAGVALNLALIAFFFGGQSQHISELERRLTAHEELQKVVIKEIHDTELKSSEDISNVLQRVVAIETKLDMHLADWLKAHPKISEKK